jgi:hypothetical protein
LQNIFSSQSISRYLWRKVVCLFCFVCTYEIHRTGILQITFLVFLESSCGEGVHWLCSMMLGLVLQSSWILNYFFIEN